jgi:spore germination cell wall hydrolase CwlJ-like protein
MIVATALTCLALNLYHEARGEPIMGRYAVAMVTINRAQQDQERVCHEVFRRKQFSWTSGVQKTPKGWKLPAHLVPKLDNPMEAHAWETAKIIAAVSLKGRMHDFTRGAEHYHADYVHPRWARVMEPIKKIGRHIF